MNTGAAAVEVSSSPLSNPNQLQVIKRDGQRVAYDQTKIVMAITKAFLAVAGNQVTESRRIHTLVMQLADQITQKLQRRSSLTIHIEDIQDLVELTLMRADEHKTMRAYVLYREERRKLRDQEAPRTDHRLHIQLADGKKIPLDRSMLQAIVEEACQNLTAVDSEMIIKETERNLFDGVTIADVHKALQLSARTLIEKEPHYNFVAARLLLLELQNEALQFLGLVTVNNLAGLKAVYADYFTAYLQKGIACELIDPKLLEFDLAKIVAAIDPQRDLQFSYLGLQTLYDRYLLHQKNKRFELIQAFFMRVAMGLAINEKDKENRAIEFYQLLSSFDFMSSTPTLFNAGTTRPQLSSCFLTTIPDDLDGIYGAMRDNALLSKFAGGLGNDWTPVRGLGAAIKGTNGKSQGVVPFMGVANASAIAVNQGGKRKGAVCGYLETWHLDIERFLELRKNTGDERLRTHDMHTANWIPDLFMKRVIADQSWTLFSPDEVSHLHDLYGAAFEKAYVACEAKTQTGAISLYKTVSALALWRKMLGMVFETGHPWLTFKDVCNLRSPQQHTGVIHSSNLCTEITLNTSAEEVAVCNLGSINLTNHVTKDGLNIEKLRHTVNVAIRMLDNVIDINYYTIPQARRSNFKHRPIGLGIMGFQDALQIQRLPYASEAAMAFADRSMEYISYYAIQASSQLAKERGSYASFENSLWSKGILPIDSIAYVQKTRGEYLQQDTEKTLDWDTLRNQVRAQGMRNSNVLAIAPTATIANICGVSQSIEPTFQNLFVKSNMSGEFTVVNAYLVEDLKALNLWDEVMINDLKYFDGAINAIDRIPQKLKTLYATAFDIEPHWLIEAASRRQKWLDQAQSLNLYMAQPSGKKLDAMYRLAWLKGLKTTYYLRSRGITSAEKSTVNDRSLNAVAAPETIAACAIDNPDCEACQ